MSEDTSKCVLRTQGLCDGQQAHTVRCTPAQTEGCLCRRIRWAKTMGVTSLAQELQHDRARTVARSADLQRTWARHQDLANLPERRW